MVSKPVVRELLEIGFGPVVRLVERGNRLAPETLSWEDQSGWLYAFVCAGEVKYIGRTINVLRSRLDGYRYGKDQGERIGAQCIAEIAAGAEVWLYGKPEPDHSALEREEAHLIRVFQPPWNRAGIG
jgi:hypothetical protein